MNIHKYTVPHPLINTDIHQLKHTHTHQMHIYFQNIHK